VTGGGAAAGPGDDPCGHGTHVAGIIAGNGAGSTGRNYYRTFYGIARKVDLIDVRVLGAAGEGAVSDVIKGIDWVLSNKAAYNIRVINLSLGHEVGEGYATDPLCRAVEKAWKAGVVVVCAAGNGGRLQPLRNPLVPDNEGHGTAYGSIQSPANSPYVITVGAMKSGRGDRDRDRIASYSGRGPSRLDFVLKPDLVAAGNQIISPNAPGSFLSDTFGGTNLVTWEEFCHAYDPADSAKYLRLSGTSMAAPVVSGAVALMLEAQPDLSPDTVKARLMLAADKWAFPDGGGADPCTFGAGYLNIPAALNNTAVATRHATSPALFRDLLGNVYIAVDTSDNGIWGTGVRDSHIMWGSGNPSTRGEMSSSGSVWGAGVWNDSAVWSAAGSRVDLSPVVIHGDAR
jgi:serine protease AprX